MITKILRILITAVILSIVLLILGLILWFVMRDSETSLQDILFYVGAAPIVIFSLGQLGNFFGRGDHTYQLSRSVSNQSANQRAVQDLRDFKSLIKSGFSWIIAGLLVWFYSAFM